MKDFKITAPDGRVIVVKAPEDTPDADLIRMAQDQAEAAPKPATFGDRLLASPVGRAVKGMKDPIDAGAQLLPRGLSAITSLGGLLPNVVSKYLDDEALKLDKDIGQSEVDYQTARWNSRPPGSTEAPGFDGMRLLGNVVNPVTLALARVSPQGAMTTLGRAGQGAVAGAMGGTLLTPVTDTSETGFGAQKLGQGITGAIGGAVATPVLGKAFDLVAPAVKRLQAKFTDPSVLGARASLEADMALQQVMREAGMEAGNIPPETLRQLRQQVLDATKKGQKLDAPSMLRQMDFDAEDLPYLRGQVTRDPGQYSRDMNVRGIEGVGEPVQNTLTAQNQGLTSKLTKLGGPAAGEPFAVGEKMIAKLKQVDEKMSASVSRAYQNARSSSGKEWTVPMQGLAQDVQAVIDDFGVGAERNAVPSVVASRLKTFGIVGDDGMTQRKIFNYEEADKLLKQINALDDGQNASLGALRAAVKKSILDAGDGAPGDPFGPARKLAAERFSLLDAVPALDAVVKGKAAPDDFVQRYIVGGKVNELKRLKEVIPDDMVGEARKQIARVIYEGAFKNNATGDKMASPAGLQQAIKSIGQEKLRVFFSADELASINRLTRIAAYANTEPAWGTVARGGNPGGVLFGSLARLGGVGGALSNSLPVIGALQNAARAQSAVNTTLPKRANLSPEEISSLARLLGVAGLGAGTASTPAKN
jgi:hypothetical protein